mmetsp:Transcript_31827/g.73113  ORF Transcript_31827/g.73113 Transcript_31827/m.73113 type:complete len:204 (-) Transcript_31827:751-1362(-)
MADEYDFWYMPFICKRNRKRQCSSRVRRFLERIRTVGPLRSYSIDLISERLVFSFSKNDTRRWRCGDFFFCTLPLHAMRVSLTACHPGVPGSPYLSALDRTLATATAGSSCTSGHDSKVKSGNNNGPDVRLCDHSRSLMAGTKVHGSTCFLSASPKSIRNLKLMLGPNRCAARANKQCIDFPRLSATICVSADHHCTLALVIS